MWWPRIALTLSILAAALLVFSGLGVRAGLWPFRVGFGMFAGAMLTGLAAIGAASIALAVPRLRHPYRILIAALLLGAASAAMPLEHLRRVKTLPYINDITTDTEDPPQFLERRSYERHFAELQRIGYPGLQPLPLALPPAQAFARALAAARAMELEIVAADEKAGRIEAVATTRWFGFKDDMVVRIAPMSAGSRIDVRSKSRVGRSDGGANARRIQEFLTRLGGERGATYHPRGNDDRLMRAARPAARAGRGNGRRAAHGHHGFLRRGRARLLLLWLEARRQVALLQGRGAEPGRAGGTLRRARRALRWLGVGSGSQLCAKRGILKASFQENRIVP